MTKDLKLIVGLGNPGKKYEYTRHNAGFDVLDEVARISDISITKNTLSAILGTGFIKTYKTVLAKPMTFMNLSGKSVKEIIEYFKIDIKNLLVIHDDIDIELGRVRIKENGGHGGHKGLKSIIECLNTDLFVRIRFGVGRPLKNANVADYVLGIYTDFEKKNIMHAANAVIAVICNGVHNSMNYFNRKDFLA